MIRTNFASLIPVAPDGLLGGRIRKYRDHKIKRVTCKFSANKFNVFTKY